MNYVKKGIGLLLLLSVITIPLWLSAGGRGAMWGENGRSPSSSSGAVIVEGQQGAVVVETAVDYQLSPPARDLPPWEAAPQLNRNINPRGNPLLYQSQADVAHENIPTDPLIATSYNATSMTPPLDFQFNGTYNPLACGGCTPPDTNGEVGPNHYVQMANGTPVSVYDKLGNSMGLYGLGSLWPGGSTCANNAGDPVVLYDQLADRWLLSQFANPNHLCVAISQTGDPLGTFHLYTFNVTNFPDYFKFGVWPDGYYMSANESSYTVYAFDRIKMLNGDPSATYQKMTTTVNNFLLPSDIDGYNPPPPDSPNYFYTFKDSTAHGGTADRVEIYEFQTDWVTPANTTFTLADSINLAPFTYTACGGWNWDCIKQLGTTQRLDSIGEWPMFRFPYRQFDDHETLLGTFNVGGGTGDVGAAIRWFELRKTGTNWSLYQEGTYDPGDGHDRWMSSIGMDGMGNIALGYSVSSSTMYPGIHYATRNVDDPLGMLQPEAILISGGGAQTTATGYSNNRWGDYSAMTVDPSNDCTFWYTNEYYAGNSISNWDTQVGVFTIPECLPAITMPAALTSTQPTNVQTTHPFAIGNNGGTALSWTIDEDDSGGAPCMVIQDIPWISSITPTAGATLAGQSETVNVQFDSAGLGPGAYTASLCVHSTDSMNPATPISLTMLIVPPNYGVMLSGNDAIDGLPSDVLTYTLTVTNTGNVTDTFNVTISNTWGTTATVTSISVGAGMSSTFDVMVTIPAAANVGDYDVATITVTSATDGSATDSTNLTTTAVSPIRYVYLPIIIK